MHKSRNISRKTIPSLFNYNLVLYPTVISLRKNRCFVWRKQIAAFYLRFNHFNGLKLVRNLSKEHTESATGMNTDGRLIRWVCWCRVLIFCQHCRRFERLSWLKLSEKVLIPKIKDSFDLSPWESSFTRKCGNLKFTIVFRT